MSLDSVQDAAPWKLERYTIANDPTRKWTSVLHRTEEN